MPDETQSIHAFDFTLICDYFASLERQGPGSPEVTLKALGFIDNLTPASRIADIGCGTGGQTLVLARHAPGQITALDLFAPFIEILNSNSRAQGLHDRVQGVVGSMEQLPFQEGELDLIWSEGAIYNIGFERGMQEWHRLLKPGGYLAVTEASWLTDERPAEIQDFWTDAYPQIDTIPNKVAQLQHAGYVPMATFVLPETCWIDHFYQPQAAAQAAFLARHPDNQAAADLVANERREARLYQQYKAFYGYVFYIGKKI
jgi:SAM-dependent methyltransferase